MIPEKIQENQAFFHTNRLRENNLTLVYVNNSHLSHNTFHFLIDNSGEIMILEGCGLDTLNIDKQSYTGSNIYNIAETDNMLLAHLRAMIISGENIKVIKSGKKSFEIKYSNIQANKGNPAGIIGSVREITNEIHLREELKIHLGYFAQLFDNSPEGIAITDSEDKVLNINGSFERLFGYSLAEIKGKNINVLVPGEFLEEGEQITRKAFFGEVINVETHRKKKDGTHINVSLTGYPITLKDGLTGLCWIFNDITSRKNNERMIKSSLLEKETLLKEVHHRVKNNLQIIGSLLKFQSKYVKDPADVKMFTDCQNRIRSISLIHEKLYQTKDISRIDFSSYTKNLVTQIFVTYGISQELISYSINANNIFLSVDNAIPCGLIINELVTNSLKYAFPERKNGHISIDLIYDRNKYILKVSDNGIGIQTNEFLDNPQTLGLQLVKTLAMQLEADLTIESENGTCYTITFSNLIYKNRL